MRKKHWIILVSTGLILSVLSGSVLLYALFEEDTELGTEVTPEIVIKEPEVINIEELSVEERKKIIRDKILRLKENHKKQLNKENRETELQKIAKEKFKSKLLSEDENEDVLVELMSAPEPSKYPIDLDISDKIRYKTIQERSLSCELSATADILSHMRDKKVAERFVISMVKKSKFNELPIEENGKLLWGDPNSGYVGFIDKLPDGKDARQTKFTGYGVLEKPIDEIYKKFGFETKVTTNQSYNNKYSKWDHLRDLLENLNEGNMIQMWGDYCTAPGFEDTEIKNNCLYFNQDRTMEWYFRKNSNLVKYEGLMGEHAFYLLGYKGGIRNPSHIIVWDTSTGKHTYKLQEWMRKWDMMQNRSIIIFKK